MSEGGSRPADNSRRSVQTERRNSNATSERFKSDGAHVCRWLLFVTVPASLSLVTPGLQTLSGA